MMSAPAVPAPLERVPNALTVLRLLLIPVFVVLLIPADGGYSWPAAIVFGVAGDHRPGRRLARPALARRVRVRQGRRPARRPADDRRGRDHPGRRSTTASRGSPSSSSSPATPCSSAGTRCSRRDGYEVNVNFLGKLATWVLYASLVFVMVTHEGTEWPLWCFWIGLALALAAGAQYVYSVMRGASA